MNEASRPVYLEEKLKQIRGDGHLGYRSALLPTWCPGCGYFSVSEGVTQALNALNIPGKDVVVVSGIGCASRFPFFHGDLWLPYPARPGPAGRDRHQAGNDALTVIVVGGDGDAFAIGAGHIPHAARRNVDMTYLLLDNGIYGLTKGQASPTSSRSASSPRRHPTRTMTSP